MDAENVVPTISPHRASPKSSEVGAELGLMLGGCPPLPSPSILRIYYCFHSAPVKLQPGALMDFDLLHVFLFCFVLIVVFPECKLYMVTSPISIYTTENIPSVGLPY